MFLNPRVLWMRENISLLSVIDTEMFFFSTIVLTVIAQVQSYKPKLSWREHIENWALMWLCSNQLIFIRNDKRKPLIFKPECKIYFKKHLCCSKKLWWDRSTNVWLYLYETQKVAKLFNYDDRNQNSYVQGSEVWLEEGKKDFQGDGNILS